MKPILYEYFQETADVLLAEYSRSRGQKSSVNIGENREVFISEFLSKVLPPRLKVTKGEIWDSSGNKTGQLDLIIIRDDGPSLTYGKNNVYLAEGVFGVIEVKSVLDRNKLKEAGDTLVKVNQLRPDKGATVFVGSLLDRPLRCVFAYEGASWQVLIDEITRNGWTDLFDLIVILSKGVLVRKGRLLECVNNKDFFMVDNKAAGLGILYFYIITYGSSFIGRSLKLTPYFEPWNNWKKK